MVVGGNGRYYGKMVRGDCKGTIRHHYSRSLICNSYSPGTACSFQEHFVAHGESHASGPSSPTAGLPPHGHSGPLDISGVSHVFKSNWHAHWTSVYIMN